MREIKFRGKRKDDGKWVYGCLVEQNFTYIQLKTIRIPINKESPLFEMFDRDEDSIVCKYEVVAETVGQYTGLTDKNSVQIYEGDLVLNDYGEPYKIEYWGKDWSGYVLTNKNDEYEGFLSDFGRYEVIGNIHDNPELLEG